MRRIQNLVINITNLCNERCAHCLRGDARTKNMDESLFKQIFDGIDAINTITITGGEPSMNKEGVVAITKYILDHHIQVDGMFIVTNGKEYCQELVDCVKAIMFDYFERYYSGHKVWVNKGKDYEYTCSGVIRIELEELMYSFGIAVSIDNYHEPISIQNYLKYLTSGVYSNVKETDFKEGGLIRRGRAQDINTSMDRKYRDIYVERNEDDIEVEDIYITVDGYVFGDCDMSYEMEQQVSPAGFLKTETLAEIIDRLSIEE